MHRYLLLLQRIQILVPVLLLVSALIGCGSNSNRASASGTVTLDDSPIELGTIEFHPSGGNRGPVAGGKIENGHYDISDAKGPVLGHNTVMIRAQEKTGRKIPSPVNPQIMIDEIFNPVPEKYNFSSELAAEIEPGENMLDFKLESK
jgi:hypothetical protein